MVTEQLEAKELTLKQEKFLYEYFKCGNGTQAAILAGYSENCAQEISSELLSKPIIRERIDGYKLQLRLKQQEIIASISSIDARKAKLTEIFSKGEILPDSITPQARVSAIQELNKMDRVYDDRSLIVNNVQVVFMIGKGYQESTGVLKSVTPGNNQSAAKGIGAVVAEPVDST